MSGWSPELHPRDDDGRFADTASGALERTLRGTLHGGPQWGEGDHTDEDTREAIERLYRRASIPNFSPATVEAWQQNWAVPRDERPPYNAETYTYPVPRGTEPNTADIMPLGEREGIAAVYRGPDGTPVGYVLFGGTLSPDAIAGVEIMPSMRGQGLGAAMYDHLQDSGKVDLYGMIGQSNSFTIAGKAFAVSWLESRIARGL